MSDNKAVMGVLHAVLCGATGYCLYKISPTEKPYAFTASVIGLCHGVAGLVNIIMDVTHTTYKAKEFTRAVVDLLPLPLVNVELFLMSESNNIALGHGLFIVPLAVDLLLGLIKDGSDAGHDVRETLKTLTVLGNITSLLFLAVNESRWLYGGMALSAFIAKFGADYVEQKRRHSGDPVNLLGHIIFYILTKFAVVGDN